MNPRSSGHALSPKDVGVQSSVSRAVVVLALAALPALIACGSKPPGLTLLDAIDQGRVDAVRTHMESGADPNKSFIPPGLPAGGASALHLAVLKDNREITEVLLDSGADIDIRARDAFQGTPLEWAAFYGIREMVVFLVEVGADLNAKNALGSTPLDAAYADNPFVPNEDVDEFVENRAFIRESLSAGGGERGTPKLTLLDAIDQEDVEALRSLLDSGADPNQTFIPPGLPAAGASALHLAVLKDNREVVEALLERGADIDVRARDESGGSPLEWAAFFGIREMVVFLVEVGADLNAKNAFGTTPLDAAYAENPFISEKDQKEFNESRAFISEYLFEKGGKSGP